MNNKLYLISEEDYIKHMEEKAVLYSMLKQVASRVKKLPSNRIFGDDVTFHITVD